MSDTLAKITNILLWVLIAVSVVFSVMLLIDSSDIWISNSLIFAYTLTIVAGAAALLFGIYAFISRIIRQPKAGAIALLPIIGLIVITFFSYNAASGEIMNIPNLEDTFSEQTYKWSGAGLNIAIVLLLLAVASIFYAEISKFFRK